MLEQQLNRTCTNIKQHSTAKDRDLGLKFRKFPKGSINKSFIDGHMGIYLIYCMRSKKPYIGQSKSIRTRMYAHENCLKRGVHGNIHLQRAYDKYGADSFAVYMIEILEDSSQLNERESFWISEYDAFNVGYNMMPVIKGKGGSKEYFSLSKGENNGNAVLSEKQVIDICELINNGKMSLRKISFKYGVAQNTIVRIKEGTRWRHIGEKYLNEEIISAWSEPKETKNWVSEEKIKNICHYLNQGVSAAKISNLFSVSLSIVKRIRNGTRRNQESIKYLSQEIIDKFWKEDSVMISA